MIAKYNQDGLSQIMVEEVPHHDVDKFGVVDIQGVRLNAGESAKIVAMVEKPPVDEAPSNLAVVGRYVLNEKIWQMLKRTPPGAGDEIQLTDSIALLMETDDVEAYYMKGKSHDCGSKLGYMKANISYALRRDDLKDELTTYIKTLL
jgi:UTP--glucose-1-phosphate uridylyltransferase